MCIRSQRGRCKDIDIHAEEATQKQHRTYDREAEMLFANPSIGNDTGRKEWEKNLSAL